jgi:hypothetical protein
MAFKDLPKEEKLLLFSYLGITLAYGILFYQKFKKVSK